MKTRYRSEYKSASSPLGFRTLHEINKENETKPVKVNHYACCWSKGIAVSAETGRRYGVTYHKFKSAKDRQIWIDEGGDFKSSPNYRDTILSSDQELRVAIKWGEVES
jgi:hypothetical protein